MNLKDAIDGLSAYDNGLGSGVHDEDLRQRVRQHIVSLKSNERRIVLSKIVRDLCLSDEAIADGYGWEDALSLCQWLDNGCR